MKIIGTLIGLILGATIGFGGALAGAVIGFLIAFIVQQQEQAKRSLASPASQPDAGGRQERLDHLEARLSELDARLARIERRGMPDDAAAAAAQPAAQTALVAEPQPAPQPVLEASPAPAPARSEEPAVAERTAADAAAMHAAQQPAARPAHSEADAAAHPPRRPDPIWAFITGGNAPVRIGIIVLFFGVAFLLKYVAERVTVPIELRLAGVAAGGVALLILGFRLRSKRPAYGLALEGAGIGVLYLTVFSALRLYALLPPWAAFALLAGIAFFSALLAVRQDALSLAVTGAIGGFLAPILASSGEGSHVILFSYYALLDAAILFIAWHKAWRVLNLVGLGFTVLFGLAWGGRHWRPELLASTEPFLIFFFLLFVAVAVLFALRRSIELKHYVDGTLVFGVPIVAFGMQSQMVRHIEFGAALSALALAAFYLALARWLYGKKAEALRLLVESFLALGIVFATLAIPLALDARWTSAAWALEGAAVYWAGLRQSRRLARAFGLALQPLAAIALIHGWVDQPDAIAVLNSGCLGSIIMALSAGFVSYLMAGQAGALTDIEKKAAPIVFAWAWLWWLIGGLIEIDRLFSGDRERDAELAFFAAWLAAMSFLGVKLDWRHARLSTLLLPCLIGLEALAVAATAPHPFTGLGAITWPLAFAVSFWLLRRHEDEANAIIASALHIGLAWIAVALGTWELDWHLSYLGAGAWRHIGWALLPAIALHLAATERVSSFWPISRRETAYRLVACAPVAVLAATWGVAMGIFSDGSAHPLPYIPLLNPVDLAIAAVALGLYRWALVLDKREWLLQLHLTIGRVHVLLGALVFIWLNGTLMRAIHHFAFVPHRFDALMQSLLVQASLSLLWSLMGVALMIVAARVSRRPLWFAGVALMGAVVLKLFLIDLSGVGTVERIVSFIGVGLLLMLVGYMAPMPPGEASAAKESQA